jgi:hypothetical protein
MTYLIDSFPEKCNWAELTGSRGIISKQTILSIINSLLPAAQIKRMAKVKVSGEIFVIF